jgi:hypothetical protein
MRKFANSLITTEKDGGMYDPDKDFGERLW